jgi:hypothetical protein
VGAASCTGSAYLKETSHSLEAPDKPEVETILERREDHDTASGEAFPVCKDGGFVVHRHDVCVWGLLVFSSEDILLVRGEIESPIPTCGVPWLDDNQRTKKNQAQEKCSTRPGRG